MPDLGRFFNVDPLSEKYSHNSTYAFSENKLIHGVELEGLEFDAKLNVYEKQVDMLAEYKGATTINEKWEYRMQLYTGFVAGLGTGAAVGTGGFLLLEATPVVIPYATSAGMVLRDPRSQHMIAEGASFAANVINPGPIDIAPTPGPGGELGNLVEGSLKNIGKWVTENTKGWSEAAKSFQEAVTGVKAGNAFELNGVRFDGIIDDVLIEAKSSYDNFVKADGVFHEWFTGGEALINQAFRQTEAAAGSAIQWHFQTQKTLDATKKLLDDAGITGIEYILKEQ